LAGVQAAAEKVTQEKTTTQSQKKQSEAEAAADLSETTEERDSDKKYHDDLKATCEKKAADFDARQKLRTEELEAIGEATSIIQGGAVSDGEKHGRKLKQALLQVKSSALAYLRAESPRQMQVAKFLQEQAQQISSRVLAAAAARTSQDPLDKVKVMIEGLIVKLQEQGQEEATKKGWCDTELATNKETRTGKQDDVDGLEGDIDEHEADIQRLKKEIKTLGSEITGINDAVKEATELRQTEQHKNEMTIRDAKEAQEAVAQALNVLKTFYAKAGEATALVQTASNEPEAPEVFGDEPYQGMGGENGGVMQMLDVIMSDFARVQAEAEAEEEAAKNEFEEFMEDSKTDKMKKTKTQEHKTGKKTNKAAELNELKTSLESTYKQLDKANEYFEKLKPDCLDPEASYAERKRVREDEIKDLTQAYDMLSKL